MNLIECDFTVVNNTFIKNTAYYSGGAIFYDLYSPKGLMSNKFSENFAKYGTSIGSYAFTLKITGNLKGDEIIVNSGEITQDNITVGIYDQEGQLVKTDSSNEGVFFTQDIENVQIIGNTKVIASQGIFNFEKIKILGRPNYTGVISVSSSIINKVSYQLVTG